SYLLCCLRLRILSLSLPSVLPLLTLSFFFFHDPAPTEIYTLSLHDALPIFVATVGVAWAPTPVALAAAWVAAQAAYNMCFGAIRSEEHTSELQSRFDLVCRLLLEKKKTTN